MGRKIAFGLSLALRLFTGVVGIYNGINERSTGATNLQKSVTAGVLLYDGCKKAGLFRVRPFAFLPESC
jgi:hypothetical protein